VSAALLDVRSLARFQETVAQTVEAHGRLDFLSNNTALAINMGKSVLSVATYGRAATVAGS